MHNKFNNSISLPVSAIYTINISDPAAGTARDFPCPDNSRIRIISAQFLLTTSGAASYPQLFIIPIAGSDILMTMAHTPQDLITACNIYFQLYRYDTYYRSPSDKMFVPLPNDFFLNPGESIRFTTIDMGANRVIEDIYITYQQWIIP